MINTLSTQESKQLYLSSCNRKCHSIDVIEKKPRTAVEWEWIVARMKQPERANLSDQEANGVIEYLQRNFLSNFPTILPENAMRFFKRHLWKSDFGANDLYVDIIYIPKEHQSLLPYLVAGTPSNHENKELFVVYINTHQGNLRPWDLAQLSTLSYSENKSLENKSHQDNTSRPSSWEVLYEDGQHHHLQGILTFPKMSSLDQDESTSMEVEIHFPDMRKKLFYWKLPIPSFDANSLQTNALQSHSSQTNAPQTNEPQTNAPQTN